MNVLLEPIKNDIQKFKWLISDLEINTSEMGKLPINHEKDWFLISAEEILPFAEGVAEIWKDGNLQVEESEIEIIAWDSVLTIVKFKEEKLSNKFKDYFEEAIELEKYKFKNRYI
ncbi:hypothetical protein GCM10023311_10020 [Flaviramulus aquimarinus]|uniref:Uncharacterized protein n=1 Tax=Flaviramulus aquimarinus TaxID=1170456 RepID=A0ABP9F4L4_9FLAO